MNTKLVRTVSGAAVIAFLAGAALPALAQTPVSGTVTTHVNIDSGVRRNGTTTVGARAEIKANASAELVTKGKARGEQEIDRRISALGKLSSRIDSMKHISDADKTSLKASIQSQITVLTTLRAKVDADTDITVLKTDIQSITKSYRIYMLIIPQGSIMAAGDRIDDLADSMTILGTKIQTRITAAQAAGKDVSALLASYADFTAKVGDSKVQAQAAITGVASLTPDNGDTAHAASNKQALESSRAKIKLGEADLKAARQDAETTVKALKTFNIKVSGSASSTAETH